MIIFKIELFLNTVESFDISNKKIEIINEKLLFKF